MGDDLLKLPRWSTHTSQTPTPFVSRIPKAMHSLSRLACHQGEEGRREGEPRLSAEGLVSFLLSFCVGMPMVLVS